MRLDDLLASRNLKLRLHTAPVSEHLAREITWVHTSELADPAPWLGSDELLLTTGMQLAAGVQADAYVRRLVKAGVVALGFGIAPVHGIVPEALIRAAERRSLPLLEVPSTTPFIAVSRSVAESWARRKTDVLQRVVDGQRGLALEAQSPDPESRVVARLASELGCWALLSGVEREIVVGQPPVGLRSWLAEQASTPRSASVAHAEHSMLLQRIDGVAGAESQRLLVVGRAEPFSTEERSLVLVAESLLATSSVSGRRAAQQALSALALELLLGGETEVGWQVARACASTSLPNEWCAVALHLTEAGARIPAMWSSPDGPFLTTVVGAHRLWLVAADASAPFLQQLEQNGAPVGYSDAVRASGVSDALVQARRAARLAQSRGSRQPIGPAELGGHSPLSAATDEQRAAAEQVLRPLLADPRGQQLMQSLQAWFDAGQHWDRAARQVGVHRHTLRHRVDDAFARVQRDAADPRDVLDVWSSLVLLEPSAHVDTG